ncbi:LysM peptidoglycan-binding domain-containing protein [Cohnella fermenti]|uniref:LysM peptidoglycan-binding domain-containing protein n=2 Tax=Cohnella fermenti TaxID=2565925 RepID=A0A4S4BM16_9BACL|nr:LysM peptidoglycan-binding domain-containing protein [Cohnella fermenti]
MILVHRGPVTDRVDVLFNPSEYSLDSANQYSWKTIPGLSMPIPHFVSGEASTLTMDLFFDSYEAQTDVRKHTMKIVGLLDVDKDLHAPPLCKFVWGSLQFKGIVEKVVQKYTMFLDSGLPVRATLTVTFREVQSVKEQYKNIPRQSADRTKQRTIKQGDQLWQIAAEEYEDPGLWREIARANGISNPKKLEPGSVIKIPRLYG